MLCNNRSLEIEGMMQVSRLICTSRNTVLLNSQIFHNKANNPSNQLRRPTTQNTPTPIPYPMGAMPSKGMIRNK